MRGAAATAATAGRQRPRPHGVARRRAPPLPPPSSRAAPPAQVGFSNGEPYLDLLLLWAALCPLGACCSVDALLARRRSVRPSASPASRRASTQPRARVGVSRRGAAQGAASGAPSYVRPSTAALLAQTALVYAIAGVAKSGAAWRVSETALVHVVRSDVYGTDLARALLGRRAVARVATLAALALGRYWWCLLIWPLCGRRRVYVSERARRRCVVRLCWLCCAELSCAVCVCISAAHRGGWGRGVRVRRRAPSRRPSVSA